MSARIICKSNVVADARIRWVGQYVNTTFPAAAAKTEKVKALPDGYSAEQFEAAVGNKSWTENICDLCGEDHELLLRIGEEPDYEARWLDVCASCLDLASRELASFTHAPTSQEREPSA